MLVSGRVKVFHMGNHGFPASHVCSHSQGTRAIQQFICRAIGTFIQNPLVTPIPWLINSLTRSFLWQICECLCDAWLCSSNKARCNKITHYIPLSSSKNLNTMKSPTAKTLFRTRLRLWISSSFFMGIRDDAGWDAPVYHRLGAKRSTERGHPKLCQYTKLKQGNREDPWSICESNRSSPLKKDLHPGFLRDSSWRVGLPSSGNELSVLKKEINST